MKNFIMLLFVLTVVSCKNEVKKKSNPVPASILIIQPEGRAVLVDSALLKPFRSKKLNDFYKATAYKSIWQSKKDRNVILHELYNSYKEGLNPSDYNVDKLKKYEKNTSTLDDAELAEYDVLLTSSLQKYITHLTVGKLNPNELYLDWDLKKNKIDVNTTIVLLLKNDFLKPKLEQLKPNHRTYVRLEKALQLINSYPKYNFKSIYFSSKIVLNDTNKVLIDIKKRLIYWKDLKYKGNLSAVYDQETEDAIKKFQARHGLAADGVIGKGTIESLNFSKNQRKAQIIANLERWKWFPKEMGKEYIIVNIPDYKLTVVKDKDTVQVYKVVVGRAERKTPVLSSKLSHVVFNPTWTVPPTIIKEDVIPEILKNRDYLAKTNIKIFDKEGNEILAEDWKLESAKGYRYVQSPGIFNSLGMVKLMFPNRFSVYLHDTNHRDYFVKNMRSLSSGCVRVENPLALTEYVIGDAENWNLEKITETLKSEKTKQLNLKKHVDVHILYWTAWSENNSLIFRDDIYNLDADLYDKLRK